MTDENKCGAAEPKTTGEQLSDIGFQIVLCAGEFLDDLRSRGIPSKARAKKLIAVIDQLIELGISLLLRDVPEDPNAELTKESLEWVFEELDIVPRDYFAGTFHYVEYSSEPSLPRRRSGRNPRRYKRQSMTGGQST